MESSSYLLPCKSPGDSSLLDGYQVECLGEKNLYKLDPDGGLVTVHLANACCIPQDRLDISVGNIYERDI